MLKYGQGRNMLQQIGNFKKEMESIRKGQMESLEIKNMKMNNTFSRSISSFHTAEIRISKFKEITQTEIQGKKK